MARIFLEGPDAELDSQSLRRLVALLDGESEGGQGAWAPPVDVVEMADRVEVTVDVPGVPESDVRVIFARGTVVVTGRKLPRVCEHSVAFHLAERSFGRFVRAIGLTGAFDAGRATASLRGGELRVVIPRIEERRGREITIEVKAV